MFTATVLECNDHCQMATPPEKAESRRFKDILFGSHFTDNEVEVVKVFLADPTTYKSFEYKIINFGFIIVSVIRISISHGM